MPYIHWEHASAFDSMTKYAKDALKDSKETPVPTTKEPYQKLMQLYMSPVLAERTDASNAEEWKRRQIHQLHIRRSLGQYYYHTLSNTYGRDRDQLVSRLLDRSNAPEHKRVIMVVDQLWLWVLEGGKNIVHFTLRLFSRLICCRYCLLKFHWEME